MHEAARHVVGASLEAARLVWEGEVSHAANIAGGLHHAMPGRASGFCVYNDVGGGDPVAARPGRRSGSRTSTSTCTTATASSRCSGTTPGC